jgi:hypothetical protein
VTPVQYDPPDAPDLSVPLEDAVTVSFLNDTLSMRLILGVPPPAHQP